MKPSIEPIEKAGKQESRKAGKQESRKAGEQESRKAGGRNTRQEKQERQESRKVKSVYVRAGGTVSKWYRLMEKIYKLRELICYT